MPGAKQGACRQGDSEVAAGRPWREQDGIVPNLGTRKEVGHQHTTICENGVAMQLLMQFCQPPKRRMIDVKHEQPSSLRLRRLLWLSWDSALLWK
eukprot:2698103-Pleurochrysis_carterae.AAC.1